MYDLIYIECIVCKKKKLILESRPIGDKFICNDCIKICSKCNRPMDNGFDEEGKLSPYIWKCNCSPKELIK